MPRRNFRFDYDNGGKGPHVSEIIDAQGHPVTTFLNLTHAQLLIWKNQGVRQIFLTYRGSWTPDALLEGFPID